MMELRYLWIFKYQYDVVILIKLTDEELEVSEKFDDFESFISECLEDKYGFRLKDSYWILTNSDYIEKHGFEDEH